MSYSSLWAYNNPHIYKEVRIEQEYPDLFSESQVQYHKELTCKYYDNLESNILDHSKLGSQLPKDLPLLMHLIRSPPHVEACQLWYHNTFWNNITNRETKPGPETKKKLEEDYGSIEAFKKCFKSTSLSHFGSGWYVLNFHRHYSPALRCSTYQNQNTPMRYNHYPLLVIDLWEHAYARDMNSKAEYLEKIWSKIDWDVVEDRYVNREKYIKQLESMWM